MNAPSNSENPVTLTEQLGEAFQLGAVLARIETGQFNMGKTVDKIDGTVTDTSNRIGIVEVTLGRHGEQLVTAFQRIAAIEHRDAQPHDHVTRDEYALLRSEVQASRLSWPKVATLVGALAAVAAILAYISGLSGPAA